jgi:hypothetical protein
MAVNQCKCTAVLISRERAIAENLPHPLHRIILMGKAEEVLQMEVPELQYNSVLKKNFSDVQVPWFCTQFIAFFQRFFNSTYTYAHT